MTKAEAFKKSLVAGGLFSTLQFGFVGDSSISMGQAAIRSTGQDHPKLISIPFAPLPCADYVLPSNRLSHPGVAIHE